MTVLAHIRRLRATTVTVGFRVLHATFAVATRSPVAIEFLERLYGAAEIGDARPSLGTFSLLTTNGEPGRRWAVSDGNSRLAVVPSLGAALNRLEREICFRTVAFRTDHIAMHGATVVTNGGAAFITGPSGAGKSTLSLALAALGYQVGGDDVAFLDPHSGTIRPVPRCFHLDTRSRRLLRGVGLTLPERALRYNFMTPADFGVTDPPAAPVRLFLFLGRCGARTTQLSALSHAEMMVRLLSETPLGAHSPGHVMATLAPLIGAAACYHLFGGRLADRARTVDKLLDQV